MSLYYLSLFEALKGLSEGKFSSEELTKACLERISELSELNSFITVTEDLALEQARAADAFEGPRGLLHGIPAAHKDLFNTKGVRSTAASRMLENYVPPYESTATGLCKDAGAVLLGKTNLDEYACGVSTERSYFGTALNPWNTEYVSGGSSGGSAAAVASGQAFFSLGTDTGGSIRQPASLSSCVGLKVTYGRVSRYGVTALASSWDTVGPLTRTVQDAALVLNVIAGQDPLDATTVSIPVPDYTLNLAKGVRGLKIGIPKEYFMDGVDEEVKKLVMAAALEYEKMGAILKEVSLPMTKYGVSVYYVTMPGELASNLARYDGVRFGYKAEGNFANIAEYTTACRTEAFGEEIKRRIMVGTYVLSAGHADAFYKQAQKVRTLIIREFEDVFKEVDVLLTPTSPTPAFKVGEKSSDPLAMYMADALTIPSCAAGLPGISLPCGFTSKGLPVGLQILSPMWSEALLLQVAAAYEQASEWHLRRPMTS